MAYNTKWMLVIVLVGQTMAQSFDDLEPSDEDTSNCEAGQVESGKSSSDIGSNALCIFPAILKACINLTLRYM